MEKKLHSRITRSRCRNNLRLAKQPFIKQKVRWPPWFSYWQIFAPLPIASPTTFVYLPFHLPLFTMMILLVYSKCNLFSLLVSYSSTLDDSGNPPFLSPHRCLIPLSVITSDWVHRLLKSVSFRKAKGQENITPRILREWVCFRAGVTSRSNIFYMPQYL